MAFVGLLGVLCGVLTLLSWIGWRFFISPVVTLDPSVFQGVEQKPFGLPRFSLGKQSRNGLWFLLLVLAVGGLGVGSVFLLSEWIAPDPLIAFNMDRQTHIQVALNPEHLVPPQALPPSMFMGSERPSLETADRNWDKLDPRFMQPVLRILSRLRERGYPFALLEGYRSPERQEMLADQGSNVTNARAFQSKHQFGLAVDLAPIDGGRLIISERDPWAMEAYSALGEEAEKIGLTWGGRWRLRDYGHIELTGSATKDVIANK